MKHGSLFSGIGGFDLASNWVGWENVFHCEISEFGQRVLKYYWPKAITYGDIKRTDFTIHRGQIDVLSGGFPCQPFSAAGKRKGTEDDRHLWPEMLRAIREIQPRYIVGENVRGFTNWNKGLVFDQAQADLEDEGYEVLPFLLPACAVNAPHRRDRIWIIAHSECKRDKGCGDEYGESEKIATEGKTEQNISTWANADTNSIGQAIKHKPMYVGGNRERVCQQTLTPDTSSKRSSGSWRPEGQSDSTKARNRQEYRTFDDGKWPSVSPFCAGNDGLPGELDGITFSKWSTESIKGGGNAIVPQVAFEIFKAIQATTPSPSMNQQRKTANKMKAEIYEDVNDTNAPDHVFEVFGMRVDDKLLRPDEDHEWTKGDFLELIKRVNAYDALKADMVYFESENSLLRSQVEEMREELQDAEHYLTADAFHQSDVDRCVERIRALLSKYPPLSKES